MLLATGGARVFAYQFYGWCGYALIEGLPLLDNQLAILEALTPNKSASSNPYELFQYRFSLDHTKVIIEGCWKAALTDDLVADLLSQTVKLDTKTLTDQAISDSKLGKVDLAVPISASELTRNYIADNLSFTVFAPRGTLAESAAACRDYLASDIQEWEEADK